jgi:hypothetical protein
MGEAGRKRAVRAELPPFDRDVVARIVRHVSVRYANGEVGGGKCIFRALCGQVALEVLGIETAIAAGGVFFRAGPRESLDVPAFANVQGGAFVGDHFCGHVWLVDLKRGELIDFSAGDWRQIWDAGSPLVGDEPPIDWQASPPEYYWGPIGEFTAWLDLSELPLGRAWYVGWEVDQPSPEQWIRDSVQTVLAGPLNHLIRTVARRATEYKRTGVFADASGADLIVRVAGERG